MMTAARLLFPADQDGWRLRPGGRWLRLMLAAVLPLALAGGLYGQARKDEQPKIPPPEAVDLETRDGLTLKATFLPGNLGKESVPIVLLHGFEGSGNEYAALAKYLQSLGHAVLVPDLRGHGGSVKLKGATRDLKASTMPPSEFAKMVTIDMEKLKGYLMEKNNAGELNIEKLCVVGSEMGAVVAMAWTFRDWSWPKLRDFKQGQDVKALVLISPDWSSHGLKATDLFRFPQIYNSISVLIIVGDGKSSAVEEAKRIHSKFEKGRPVPAESKDRDLFYLERKTKLQGTKLVDVKTVQVDKYIAQFIKLRLTDQSYPWTIRRSDLQKATE